MRIKRSLTLALAAMALGSACTPNQVSKWIDWWEDDPESAVEFANLDWVQASLRTRQPLNEEDPGAWPATREEASDGWGKWDPILECESGGDWHIDLGTGYSGGLQFLNSTWRAYGGTEFAPRAGLASPTEQILIAERVLDDVGWGAWPTCSRRAGYR